MLTASLAPLQCCLFSNYSSLGAALPFCQRRPHHNPTWYPRISSSICDPP